MARKKKEKVNLFAKNTLYWFDEDGVIVPPGLVDEDRHTPMLKARKVKPGEAAIIKQDITDKNVKGVKTIFKPAPEIKKGFWTWFQRKFVRQSNDSRLMHRFHRIHVVAKNMMFKPGIKVLKWVLKDYMIKDLEDIPAEPYNNHHRIFYYCFQKAIEDGFAGIPYNKDLGRSEQKYFDNRSGYIKWLRDVKFWSYDNRTSILNLLMTEAMEDTFDREVLNYFMLRMYHQMHELYEGSVPRVGEYPIYRSKVANDGQYFDLFGKLGIKTWDGHKNDKMDLWLKVMKKDLENIMKQREKNSTGGQKS